MINNNELIEKLLSLLQSKQYGAVKSLVQDMNEVDVAEAIEEIFEENEEPETSEVKIQQLYRS